ncbi:CobW family GTP-binding protein [Paracoccus alkanivorans]|uniref:GTP-binding protein n=1 Tax=Paracoccus alkanivorans TaxID=2116655 RepID=A0A3M0MNC4_9RHOB|nr:GTP-binding protein [Paracoccus alkanivorans]RMC37200.1 GTP-binding protein [Paracoccus alkanivorans]
MTGNQSSAPAPITLLTGFLGSGKTTVLNTLLRHPDFSRTAVIMNEFGETGLDRELVVSTTESLVLLQSGCMCCTLRGDLLETLIELGERREAGELEFARVVIETTGLADPAPILHTLITSAELAGRFVMDGVVATVDAAIGLDALHTQEEARRQAALADLILLTKTDLPDADEAALRSEIAFLNAGAPVEIVVNGAVEPSHLTGLGHFDLSMKSKQAQAWLRADDVPAPGYGDPDIQRHLDSIRAISWMIEEPLSASMFDLWMDLLMARRGGDILRFKGLVHLKDMSHPFVVHGVQHIFHPPVLLTDWQGSDRRSKLVLIVRHFTDLEFRKLFRALNSVPVIEHVLPGGYLSAEVA